MLLASFAARARCQLTRGLLPVQVLSAELFSSHMVVTPRVLAKVLPSQVLNFVFVLAGYHKAFGGPFLQPV